MYGLNFISYIRSLVESSITVEQRHLVWHDLKTKEKKHKIKHKIKKHIKIRKNIKKKNDDKPKVFKLLVFLFNYSDTTLNIGKVASVVDFLENILINFILILQNPILVKYQKFLILQNYEASYNCNSKSQL